LSKIISALFEYTHANTRGLDEGRQFIYIITM